MDRVTEAPLFELDGLVWLQPNKARTSDLHVACQAQWLLCRDGRRMIGGELLGDGSCTLVYAIVGDFAFGQLPIHDSEVTLHYWGKPPQFAVLAKSDHYNYGVLDTLEEAERRRGEVGVNCTIVPFLGVEE